MDEGALSGVLITVSGGRQGDVLNKLAILANKGEQGLFEYLEVFC